MHLLHGFPVIPVAMVAVCLTIGGQVPEVTISEEEVDAAIALGKSTAKLEPYRLSGFFVGNKGYVLTPFLRIASLARTATKQYQTFSMADVPAESLTPLIDIVVPAYDLADTDKNVSPLARFVDVQTVLIMPKGSKDPAAAVRPIRTVDNISVLQNAFGMKIETKGLVAQFPRDAFKEDYEIVIVYERRLGGGKQECRGGFKESDLRKWR